jgi:hypothetical protein
MAAEMPELRGSVFIPQVNSTLESFNEEMAKSSFDPEKCVGLFPSSFFFPKQNKTKQNQQNKTKKKTVPPQFEEIEFYSFQ